MSWWNKLANNRIEIEYTSYMTRFSDLGLEEVYCFYPDGIWDEDKLLLSEAIKKYPQLKYKWIKIEEDLDSE